MFTPKLIEALTQTERGNTLLVREDGDILFIADVGTLESPLWFIIEFLPFNYPSFNTLFKTLPAAELRTELQKSLGGHGWMVRKNNLELAVVGNPEEILWVIDPDNQD